MTGLDTRCNCRNRSQEEAGATAHETALFLSLEWHKQQNDSNGSFHNVVISVSVISTCSCARQKFGADGLCHTHHHCYRHSFYLSISYVYYVLYSLLYNCILRFGLVASILITRTARHHSKYIFFSFSLQY